MAEAAGVLAAEGNDAAVLAGGQSLLIDLRYRRVRPRLLLDINRVAELAGLGGDETAVRIGALVRHRELEQLPLDDPLAALLARAAAHVAHPPVRTRGTLAGSVAWAHPAAEWCAITAGLAGTVETASTAGTRLVPAADWFAGRHRTSRRAGELVTAVWLPRLGPGTGIGFAEHRRTHGSFALAAAAAAVRVAGGRVSWARIGLANAGETPLRAVTAEQVLTGQPVSARLLAAAADRAAADAQPVPEPYCEHGVCGSCTVLLDGVAARSCLLLTVQCEGAEIGTVEGLARDGELHPLQQAFTEEHALQCGFCTPGFLMLLAGELAADPELDTDPARLDEVLASNLCRCTGYHGIRRAAVSAARRMRRAAGPQEGRPG